MRRTDKKVVQNKDTCSLHPWQPSLLECYNDHATKISKILRGINHKLFHVGSSSVEGLLGKGIVDILLALPTWHDEAIVLRRLKKLGYTHIHPRVKGRRFLSLPKETGFGDIHIHIVRRYSTCYRQHLKFKALLTKNARLRQQYSHLKISLAQQGLSRAEYTEQKGRWIEQVLAELGD